MYTWEIKEYIKVRDFILTSEEILKVTDLNENPQIKYVKFDAYDKSYYVQTEESDLKGNIYSDSYKFNAYAYDYVRVGNSIVLREEKEESIKDAKVLLKK